MRLDDRLALGDGIEYLGDTVRDIVFDYIADEERRQRDTNHRTDEIPKGMLTGYEFGLYQPLYQMDELLEDICRKGGKAADKETQEEHQLLLANMALPPVYYFVVQSQDGMKDRTLPAPPYKGREIEDSPLPSLQERPKIQDFSGVPRGREMIETLKNYILYGTTRTEIRI